MQKSPAPILGNFNGESTATYALAAAVSRGRNALLATDSRLRETANLTSISAFVLLTLRSHILNRLQQEGGGHGEGLRSHPFIRASWEDTVQKMGGESVHYTRLVFQREDEAQSLQGVIIENGAQALLGAASKLEVRTAAQFTIGFGTPSLSSVERDRRPGPGAVHFMMYRICPLPYIYHFYRIICAGQIEPLRLPW
ncbi:hypothetical protein BDV98DRAFT_628074 [Pterulicium gracile]|uniref:Uncharacterized protein n=1 Tax=Pterulicium gracile TaxID=1884261 RepID=A0A5C3Q978_9AGAR|nr:hypothetical protein BDV98DRAFT_628074 [Pterula gracilis]